MRRSLVLLASALALAGCGRAREVTAAAAWVRLAAVPGRPSAAYVTIHGGSTPERLTGVRSALVQRVELHQSMAEGGAMGSMMTMKPLAGVDVPAHTTVKLAPGGDHAMLFGVDPRIQPGTAIPMALLFASGKAVEVEAKTVPLGGAAPY